MITNVTNTHTNHPTFGKFLKYEGKSTAINKLRAKFQEKATDTLTLKIKKSEEKSILYVLTGKHYDEFIDIINNRTYFRELRTNIEKYLKSKPEKFNI